LYKKVLFIMYPAGIENYKKIYPNEIKYCNIIEETIKNADITYTNFLLIY
jgi:hypothetical protein